MSTRIVERIDEWESVPFDGGYAGLHRLADDGFAGVVVTGPTRLFMLDGTVVGVLDGEIEDFDGADGTARRAPHEALPLLAVMQERADEVRAKYYTQDTPVAEVDNTLSNGNFTGYVELSENVLSGDYYQVYHQGRSMSVAYVGSSSTLVTDDEAFEDANDEVGIYEVRPADIEPVAIPEPASEPGTTNEGGGTAAATPTDDPEPADAGEPDPETDTETPATASTRGDRSAGGNVGPAGGPPGSKAAGAGPSAGGRGADEQATRERQPAEGTTTSEASSRPETETTSETPEPAGPEASRSEPQPEAESGPARSATAPAETEQPDPEQPTSASARDQRAAKSGGASARTGEPADRSGGSVSDLETRSVPSLDPDRSTAESDDQSLPDQVVEGPDSAGSRSEGPEADDGSRQPNRPPDGTGASEPPTQPDDTRQGQEQPASDDRSDELTELRAELDERTAEVERLESELADQQATTEELREERDRLQSELEEAREEIERLQSELTEEGGAAAGQRLRPGEAIDGTNLFVRYDSKGEATLEKAHDGEADRSSVEANLRLEYHTQFEATEAVVDGEPYESFLQSSLQYRFVEWLTNELLYEIRDTGHAGAMEVLYDALPKADRAELNGQVSVTYTEDGQQHRSQQRFDVVVRDRMGNPLIVANINNSRNPATDDQMGDLITSAERVGNASGSLAGAFLVTSSFFEPGALETAEEATSSGLFSRDKRKSFVNLSRKDGYHLCLLEARNQEFHLAVPEL